MVKKEMKMINTLEYSVRLSLRQVIYSFVAHTISFLIARIIKLIEIKSIHIAMMARSILEINTTSALFKSAHQVPCSVYFVDCDLNLYINAGYVWEHSISM